MSDLIPYRKQFKKIAESIESTKETAYRKVSEELILMYRDIGERISLHFDNAKCFEPNYPNVKRLNRREIYRMNQFYQLHKGNEMRHHW